MIATWLSVLKKNSLQGVRTYLREGGDPNEVDENGESVLFLAMRHHCESEVIDALIEGGARIDYRDAEGVSVLDVTITYNRLDLFERLLGEGIDAEGVRQSGFTPLMAAACYGREAMVKRLMEIGVDVDARDRQGLSAADFARKMGKSAILKLLREG